MTPNSKTIPIFALGMGLLIASTQYLVRVYYNEMTFTCINALPFICSAALSAIMVSVYYALFPSQGKSGFLHGLLRWFLWTLASIVLITFIEFTVLSELWLINSAILGSCLAINGFLLPSLLKDWSGKATND